MAGISNIFTNLLHCGNMVLVVVNKSYLNTNPDLSTLIKLN